MNAGLLNEVHNPLEETNMKIKTKNYLKKSNKKDKFGNLIDENFRLGLRHLSGIKSYVIFAFILFLFMAIVGFIFPVFFEKQILSIIDQLIMQTENLSGPSLVAFIFTNNLRSSLFGAVSGIFLAIGPLVILIINGYVLGFVAGKTVALTGFGVLWRLLPHGIFELPAVFISAGLGIHIGISLVLNSINYYAKKISNLSFYSLVALSLLLFPIAFVIVLALTLDNKELKGKFFGNVINSFRAFVFVVMPLLIIAAIIEGILITLLG
jgi:uncharacterized membrane protein SpoIIM required for sporulation